MSRTAQQYLCGLMQADKRNMERMAEVVPNGDDQVLQNFLTHSSWDYRLVMDQVARNANQLIGAEVGTGLYIDESGFQKKGVKSVGVARTGAWESRTTARSGSLVRSTKGIEFVWWMRDCICRRSGRAMRAL